MAGLLTRRFTKYWWNRKSFSDLQGSTSADKGPKPGGRGRKKPFFSNTHTYTPTPIVFMDTIGPQKLGPQSKL